ncbi:FRG domain-containing protein [Leifsonia sp. NPDC058248]|uniref:FRG domain-containing protein n=1 Tax=Leifsonia sp. NPDC058248 TaxID=3346402 RepID=UPI0036D97729
MVSSVSTGPASATPEWNSPASVFTPWEAEVTSWPDFLDQVQKLTARYSGRELVWRGARSADWALQSSLYRRLSMILERAPTESEMAAAERQILRRARYDWRFDNLSAMQIFASLQHYGGPTRLLDVTANPLIAAWFAVEPKDTGRADAARVFAFASKRPPVHLRGRWAERYPWWFGLRTDPDRIDADWGTGHNVRVWRPPAYSERIAAQNAGFIIDGAPVGGGEAALCRIGPESRLRWTLSQIQETSSINLRFGQIERTATSDATGPMYTLKLEADAIAEIRDQLQRVYGYRASSIYADMSGLSAFLTESAESLTDSWGSDAGPSD